MRKWIMVPAAVLLVLPAVVLWMEGADRRANASPGRALAALKPAIQAPPAQETLATVTPAALQPDSAPATTGPVWVKAPALQKAVEEAMADFPGRYSVIVQDLAAGERFAVNPTERYHPASTIKMPVTLYALEQYRAGKIGWYDGIVYTEADFESPGGGAFETAPFGGVYPVENLVGRALRYSNNVAVNMLGRHLGWENIRAFTRSIGGELYRRPDGTPEVTAESELGWWLYLEKLSREDAKRAELLLQPLREVAYDGRIAAGLPAGVQYLHKFGSYDGNYHDGGIVYAEQPYILVVMTYGADVGQADVSIAEVSRAVYGIMSQR